MKNDELREAFRCLASAAADSIVNEYETRLEKSNATINKLEREMTDKDATISILRNEIERLNAELEQFKSKTKVKPATLGYSKTFAPEVYVEMDKMIRLGYSNRMIAERLNIHPNTVTNRRRKLKNA